MGIFWDQIRARLTRLFEQHPELVFWVLEQGPQTTEALGYDVLRQELHKLVHGQDDGAQKSLHLHRLIEFYRSNHQIGQAIVEAKLLRDGFFDAWLDGMVLLHLFTPDSDPNEERQLLDAIHDFRTEQYQRHPESMDPPIRDDEETRLWIARTGINPWIGDRFGLDRVLLHRFRNPIKTRDLHANLTTIFEGLPHRSRLYPSHGRPTVQLDGLRRHIEGLAKTAVRTWLIQANLIEYWDDFEELIDKKFDNEYRPIRRRIWHRIQKESSTLRKVDALIALYRVHSNPIIQREIFKLFQVLGEDYTGEERCVEMIVHLSYGEFGAVMNGFRQHSTTTSTEWQIFKDTRWLFSDRLDPEQACILHGLGMPIL